MENLLFFGGIILLLYIRKKYIDSNKAKKEEARLIEQNKIRWEREKQRKKEKKLKDLFEYSKGPIMVDCNWCGKSYDKRWKDPNYCCQKCKSEAKIYGN
jgi:hypothetical protein